MERRKDHPGVYIPPPLIYVAFFFLSILLQKVWPFKTTWPGTIEATVFGWSLVALGFLTIAPAIARFIGSKNTLITVKPARSLQTTGIYAHTRNPMYLGLLLLYCGIAFFRGNWWTFIVVPLLIFFVHQYIIKKEERYLQRAFGEEFTVYKKRVRSWI